MISLFYIAVVGYALIMVSVVEGFVVTGFTKALLCPISNTCRSTGIAQNYSKCIIRDHYSSSCKAQAQAQTQLRISSSTRIGTKLHLVEVTQIIGFIEVSVFALALPSCKDAYDKYKCRQEEIEGEVTFDKAFVQDFLRREKRGQELSNFENSGS